ncbi:MAG: porphobilinogen synthase [Oscillospiraceae bacterium]|nr:porphobilinogen synthase [Oscillospiraceae bacterium]
MELIERPRRLRGSEVLRKMVRETRIDPSQLIYPAFVAEGIPEKQEIRSMPGQYRHTRESLLRCAEALLERGVDKMILFGIPQEKDELGSQAYCEHGIVQQAMRDLKAHFPELYLIGDVCMCEYTSHGHCGILHGERVDNDETLSYLAKIALSQVEAGADMVAPSDMMDGRVAAIRELLDERGHLDTPIMSYAVKYASSFYGPFREAADSAPSFGDRKSYQMDFHNIREGIKEALLDESEGADIIMVKPAMAFGDVIAKVKEAVLLPIATYSVSGEYAMVKCAAQAGCIDEARIVCEMAASAFRAGTDLYLTYFAPELAGYLREGRIG